MLRLPQRAEEQGMAGSARDGEPARVSRRQEDWQLRTLGADLHRDQ